jgi:hypothetical protein
MDCTLMAKTVIVSDDARLAAQLSSLLMTPGTYLPVLDGPRLGRPTDSLKLFDATT